MSSDVFASGMDNGSLVTLSDYEVMEAREKANGSSLRLPIPPNHHHDERIASWQEKGERGHNVTCVISVKKLDDC
ncbi:hypothetical protein TNCV_1300751 [Trichonephila clavipes]|nr:hypothetical protein TNCV_1300751 [Trichonephila clavipes]